MEYRTLGRTGLRVSEIALGCEGFNGKTAEFASELFSLALGQGVNCMDLYTPNPEVHAYVANALRGRRESFILQAHLCTEWKGGQYKCVREIGAVKKAFEALLKNLETDYIDIGMIHYVDSPEVWREIENGPVMEYAQKLKSEGKIHHIGVSSHNPAAAIPAVESGLVDVLMFSVNPCYDLLPGDENCDNLFSGESYEGQLTNADPERVALYELCQSKGVGITVMKAFGGGDLLDASLSPAGAALTPAQCIHYALTRPAVGCVMTGAHSLEELKESLAYETAPLEERDFAAAFASFPRIKWQGHCMYCGHCAPCPVGIDVATVTKFLNLARAQGEVPETVREHYAALSHKADECVSCGACDGRCPFGVKASENIKAAAELFAK